MHHIHLTQIYKNKIKDSPVKDSGTDRLRQYLNLVDLLQHIKGVISYPKNMLVYSKRRHDPKIIIQKKTIKIDNSPVEVLFFRDFIAGRDIDFYWNKKAFTALRDGNWLEMNPLPENEIQLFKKNFQQKKDSNDSTRSMPPHELNTWINDYRLKINFDIYETENWVKYSTNRGVNGLEEKYIILFKRLFKKIMTDNADLTVQSIGHKNLKYAIDNEEYIGIIYADYSLSNENKTLLIYGGAHTLSQSDLWENLKQKCESEEITPPDSDIEEISKAAFRAYPKWVIESKGQNDLWSLIQRSKGINNLSLLPEQIQFLKDFQFPYYINGQAGSGKSTMLYYIFANVYYYKCSDMFEGDIVFLTENENLIKETQKAVISLLQLNPEFEGATLDDIGKVKNSLISFKNYLLKLLPDEIRSNYHDDYYLDFGSFKNEFNRNHTRKHSAEEVWFVLSTYVYGYFENIEIDTTDKYHEHIPQKFQLIKDKGILSEILEEGLPFYKNLIDNGWWDKNQLVREIRKIFPDKLPCQYTVIFCDEAQDFSRIELRLIIESSIYMNYDLSQDGQQVPIVFAGDALQTVNPVGFSVNRLHQMLYDILTETGFEYDKKGSTYNPKYNYRSFQHVVHIANIIQQYRNEFFEDKGSKQEAKIQGDQHQKPIIYSIEWLQEEQQFKEFKEKFKYKSFIIPVDLNEEEKFKKQQPLLKDDFADIKSSIAAKGAEYAQVVVYGFGDEYLKTHPDLGSTKVSQDFKIKFFFNKLYVAVTRAQKELVIIDSENSIQNFWIPLLEQSAIKNKWINIKIDDLVNINPQTFNYVLESNKNDALENASIDFKLGKKDKNISRLSVAANIFLQLGENVKSHECIAYRNLIIGDWEKAASQFIKANQMEKAAEVLFKNQAWKKLRFEVNGLQEDKHELRLLISRFMNNGNWTEDELQQVSKFRNHLNELLNTTSWRTEFIKKLLQYATSNAIRGKRDLVYILEAFVRDDDDDILKAIALNYFQMRYYSRAIEYWKKVSAASENNEDFYPQYAIAHIEQAKDKENLHEELTWSGRLAIHESCLDEQRYQLTKKIVNVYKQPDKGEDLLQTSPKEEFIQYLYLSIIYQKEIEYLSTIGTEIEQNFGLSCQELLHVYENIIPFSNDESISLFLKERWVKIYTQQNKADLSSSKFIDQLNSDFKNCQFPFENSDFKWTPKLIEEISPTPSPIPSNPPKHYHHFKINNFRGFEELEIKNIGQFNLILGNNNIGKTSFLEAFTLGNDVEEIVKYFMYLLKQRSSVKHKHFSEIFKTFLYSKASKDKNEISYTIQSGRRKWNYKLSIPSNKDLNASNIKGEDPQNYIFMQSSEGSNQLSNLFPQDSPKKINFIPFGKGYSEDLASIYYESIGQHGRKIKDDFTNNVMKLFIPNIVDIDLDPQKGEIMIEEEGFPKLALYNYGEGANKLFRIMVQIYAAEGNRLMIDEIDAGIHHSKFKEFWKKIIIAANNKNVQLFISTHNQECIDYFTEALNELEQNSDKEKDSYTQRARIITLEKHIKTNKLVSIVRDYERIEYAQNYRLKLRGQDS